MSLSGFIQLPEVVAKLKPFRPKLSRKIPAPLLVPPKSIRYALVGIAFDYLLRFELQRQAPHAVATRWVAEYAPDIIWKENDKGGGCGLEVFKGADPRSYDPIGLANRVRKIVQTAKSAVAAYVECEAPTHAEQIELATHVVRLAHLEAVYRTHSLDPQFEEVHQEDVEDLLAMLTHVPFKDLISPQALLLNPTFGDSSRLVGGSDADLITGDMLVDFKVTKRGEMEAIHLDQLLGFFLLARHHRCSNPTFPTLKRIALYFGRQGCLWSFKAELWTSHPEFADFEKWFINYAENVFGARK